MNTGRDNEERGIFKKWGKMGCLRAVGNRRLHAARKHPAPQFTGMIRKGVWYEHE
jgi:hypothetical protein